MDEYPYSESDLREGFLMRFINENAETQLPQVTEHLMENYLYLGQRDNTKSDMLIEQICRRTTEPGNDLVKPLSCNCLAMIGQAIVLQAAVLTLSVHRNLLRHGKSQIIPESRLRMNLGCSQPTVGGRDAREFAAKDTAW
eukprot:CAMPEP_0117443910 /NCGR_PEP_ID=MMETSP0759-20121206/4954_1 /TAXON_ID=63605 /ORGANISM="Percolomonas cosmopolitus, Strain WS" /LENGTH=139 /DNA_ID=CAMNT_0005235931 /DNA_START=465 /DNA_END=885 /DNA_ORIENTATION=-